MEYRKCGHTIILRLDPGDEIISSLTALAENENIRTAQVQGLGASNHAKIALYDLEKKEFHRKTLDVPMEIASLNGNIKTGSLIFTCTSDLPRRTSHSSADIWSNASSP